MEKILMDEIRTMLHLYQVWKQMRALSRKRVSERIQINFSQEKFR